MSGEQKDDKITQIRRDIDATKETLVTNIELATQRGEKLENLDDRANELQQNANLFNKSAKQARRRFWFRDLKASLLLIVLIIIGIWLLLSLICGFDFSRCGA
eukprot:193624_1